MSFEFLKRLSLPRLDLSFGKSASVAGIDIGMSSIKVVQLRKESERGILETYGELKTAAYLKSGDAASGGGFLRFLDADIIGMVTDVLRESNVTTKNAVVAIPAVSSFVTMIELPTKDKKEVAKSVPFEARKHIPVPISEVALDWQIIDEGDSAPADAKTKVVLVAVPIEVLNKLTRIIEATKLNVRGMEIETFSMVRSLVGHDKTVTALVNFGSQSTTLAIVDKGVVMLSHNLERGSIELTNALSRGLGITTERAEAFKREIGLSSRPEDREITSVMTPLIDILLADLERIVSSYDRRTERKTEKINITGGGAKLKGLVDQVASRFGVETIQGNPFARVTYPAFMQPILKDLGPSFSVAAGLALRETAPK